MKSELDTVIREKVFPLNLSPLVMHNLGCGHILIITENHFKLVAYLQSRKSSFTVHVVCYLKSG